MASTRAAERTLRLAASSSSQQYICRACRTQAARQFHTSRPAPAEIPFYKRLQNQLFGSKESQEDEKSREEKRERRREELSQQSASADEPEVKVGTGGKEYKVAALVDLGVNTDYVEATSADGLDIVGSVEWVKAKADRGEQYVGFLPKRRVELERRQWQMLLHHIMVEILVLQKGGRLAGEVCYPRSPDTNVWMHTRNASIEPAATGKGTRLSFTDPQAEQSILQAIPEQLLDDQLQDDNALFSEVEGAVAEGALVSQQGKDGKGFQPPTWMDVSIADPSVKMALIKRTMQLTGKRVPDPAISSSTTLADIYQELCSTAPPRKLHESKQIQKLKINAPNVSVHSNRQTPIHKERAIGRWKLIEEELVRRDLPVTGSRWPQGTKATYRS